MAYWCLATLWRGMPPLGEVDNSAYLLYLYLVGSLRVDPSET